MKKLLLSFVLLTASMMCFAQSYSSDLVSRANRGDADAQNLLGTAYYKGDGISKDYKKALEWWLKAADQGQVTAMVNVGNAYLSGWGVATDHMEAAKWYEKAAKKGSKDGKKYLSWAWNYIGTDYHMGRKGLKQDDSQALKYWKMAAEGGSSTALDNLGNAYSSAWGVEKDYKEATKWYQKAIDTGENAAYRHLGNLYFFGGYGIEKNYSKAVELYRRAYEKDIKEPSMINRIAQMYAAGDASLSKDMNEALRWWKVSADKGDREALSAVASYYENGYGVPKNLEEAFKWHVKAAEKGSVWSLNKVANAYYYGSFGQKENPSEAAKWYEKLAKARGTGLDEIMVEDAKEHLGFMYFDGEGVDKNYEKAFEWFSKCKTNGAKGKLGEMYYNGLSVEKDYNKAFELLNTAATNMLKVSDKMDMLSENMKKSSFLHSQYGNTMRLLAACYRYGLGTAKDAEKEKFWMDEAAKHYDDKAKKIIDGK